MIFLELEPTDLPGRKVSINADCIATFYTPLDGEFCAIRLTNNDYLVVTASYEEIKKLLSSE